jgi:hypothetical protein
MGPQARGLGALMGNAALGLALPREVADRCLMPSITSGNTVNVRGDR